MKMFLTKLKALRPWDRFHPHQLGAAYATGDEVSKDEAAALRWYGLGARRGDRASMYDLGFMVLLGEGTAPDPNRAEALLRQAAELGFPDAARLLSDLYSVG